MSTTVEPEAETTPVLRRQMPPWAFATAVIAAVVAVLAVVGALMPATPDGARPNKPAPEIASVTPDGKPIKLSDFKGKVVLLNFWATWCGPCKMELPDLIALQKQYEGRGFTILGVANETDPDPAHLAAGVKALNINYPVAFGTREAGQAYKIDAIPRTLLIDREGRVVLDLPANIIDREYIAKEIEKLL
jgi:thiol-disulfide isomerase/thioredoxin